MSEQADTIRRQSLLIERALAIIHSEYGYSRKRALEWLEGDNHWNEREDGESGDYFYPKECRTEDHQ